MFRDFAIVKAIGVAIAVEMVGFQMMNDLRLVQLYPRGFYWGANILGGLMFGFGVAIAGGCIMGATYQAGEGMVGSMLALVGIAVGAAATLDYPLAPFRNMLQAATKIQINDLSPTIPLELHVSPWFIIIPVVIVLVFFAQSRYRQERKTKSGSISPLGQSWPW
jgi:uncharacterized membrane protein YedE/YeeE